MLNNERQDETTADSGLQSKLQRPAPITPNPMLGEERQTRKQFCPGEPSKELVDAVNAMADLAYTKLSKRKPLSTVNEADAKEIIKAGYPQFFITGNWHLSDESVGVGEPCKKLHGRIKAFNFWFFDDKMGIDDCDDEKILTLDDVNYDVKLQCYIKAHQFGYYVKELAELVK